MIVHNSSQPFYFSGPPENQGLGQNAPPSLPQQATEEETTFLMYMEYFLTNAIFPI